MQTIVTKYHGPTNRLAARISATSTSGNRVYVSYDHSLPNGLQANHMAAARELRSQIGWEDEMMGGHLAKGDMVWVIVPGAIKLD